MLLALLKSSTGLLILFHDGKFLFNIAFTNMQVEKWVETPIKNNGGTEDW